MSIYYSGALKRSQGIVSAIAKQLKRVNLKGVNRITVTFDPFAEDVKSTRQVVGGGGGDVEKVVKMFSDFLYDYICTSEEKRMREKFDRCENDFSYFSTQKGNRQNILDKQRIESICLLENTKITLTYHTPC